MPLPPYRAERVAASDVDLRDGHPAARLRCDERFPEARVENVPADLPRRRRPRWKSRSGSTATKSQFQVMLRPHLPGRAPPIVRTLRAAPGRPVNRSHETPARSQPVRSRLDAVLLRNTAVVVAFHRVQRRRRPERLTVSDAAVRALLPVLQRALRVVPARRSGHKARARPAAEARAGDHVRRRVPATITTNARADPARSCRCPPRSSS